MSDHPLCCDCEDCLNGAGGYVLPGAGVTRPDPGPRVRMGGTITVTLVGARAEAEEMAQRRAREKRREERKGATAA